MKRMTVLLLIMGGCLIMAPDGAVADSAVRLTVTNQDIALIQETRTARIAPGRPVQVVMEDMPKTVDPRSVQLTSLTAPEQFRVLSMVFQHNTMSAAGLLDRFVGKDVKVVIRDPKGPEGALITRDATLLANSDRPVFAMDDQIYIGSYEAVWLPSIPVELRSTPAFVWTVDNNYQQPQQLSLTYLAQKLGWDAAYTLTLDDQAGAALLEGWMVVHNESGKDYRAAGLKLIAGKLRVAGRPLPEANRFQAKAVALAGAPQAREPIGPSAAFEYYLYQVPGAIDLPDRQDVQIAFVQTRVTPVVKELVSRGTGADMYGPLPIGSEERQDVQVRLKFDNKSEDGLGMPLPSGDLRAFQRLPDGQVIIIGEDRIKHTPVDATVKLIVGSAFDVIVRRTLTGFEKMGKNVLHYDWELVASNSKDRDQEVLLEEEFPGEWKILNSSVPYEKLDATSVRFKVKAPAKGRASVRYQVELNRG